MDKTKTHKNRIKYILKKNKEEQIILKNRIKYILKKYYKRNK